MLVRRGDILELLGSLVASLVTGERRVRRPRKGRLCSDPLYDAVGGGSITVRRGDILEL